MSDFAILLRGEAVSPLVVRLRSDRAGLDLLGTDFSERIPWWRLYRVDDSSSTHRFRRMGERRWELSVTAGADKELLAHIGPRPIHRFLGPLRRLESVKLVIGIAVLALTVAQHVPPRWLAEQVPLWAQERLADGLVGSNAPYRCDHEGGEAAVRKLLMLLDPATGAKIDIIANRNGGFIVTAIPGNHLIMYRSSLAEIDPDALPALLAHELSHVRHGDPMVAAIRGNGFLQTWGLVMEAGGSAPLRMDFSGAEERRADLEAMAMMRRAGMALKPAAEMFEQMRVSKEQGTWFGYEQREFHFGIDSRARRWAAAARSDAPAAHSLLSEADKDALFNFCWAGPIPATRLDTSHTPAPAMPPGSAAVGNGARPRG